MIRARQLTFNPDLDLASGIFSRTWWARFIVLTFLVAAAVLLAVRAPLVRQAVLMPTSDAGFNHTPSATSSAKRGLAPDMAARQLSGASPSLLRDGQNVDRRVRPVAGPIPRPVSQSQEADKPAPKARTQQPVFKSAPLIVASGEALSETLGRANVPLKQALAALSALDKVTPVRRVQPGARMTALIASMGGSSPSIRLDRVTLNMNRAREVIVTRSASGGYSAEMVELERKRQTRLAEGRIVNSLYVSASQRKVPAATIVEMIRALSYRVDFQREVRPGNRFAAVFEEDIAADGSVHAGDLLYAELALNKRTEAFYRFVPPGSHRADYFNAKGESLRRLLMRTPIDGARLTSGFGKRKHPVLGYVRSHRGVDFGAPTGTPIYAAGDGVITRASRYGSFGNYVRIKHKRGFSTAYAHLSRYGKGMKSGKRVRQGDIIGYVGATGRVTGAHLHYEVFRNGKQVNPMRLDLPTGEVLEGRALTAFRKQMKKVAALRAQKTAKLELRENVGSDGVQGGDD